MVLILRLFTNDSTHGRQMYIVGVLESIKKTSYVLYRTRVRLVAKDIEV